MSDASGSPPAKHGKNDGSEPEDSPPQKEEKSRTVPALSAPVQPALLKVRRASPQTEYGYCYVFLR